jgi:hypothetical protein
MAVLSSLSVNGILQANSIVSSAQEYTPWVRMYHCADADSTSICNPVYSCGWLHVRTPLPATSVVQNLPSMLEVIGFHTYSEITRITLKQSLTLMKMMRFKQIYE